MLRPLRRVVAVLATAVLLTSLHVLAPSPAQAGGKLICRAHVSDRTPARYSRVRVYVKTGQAHAKVRAVAHYKTTTTAHSRKSNSAGKATVPFYTAGATPGRTVRVTVTVWKNGHKRTCSTSFTPHR